MSNSGDLMISLASGRRPPGIKSPLMFPQGRMYMDDFRRNEHNYELLRRNTIVISTINHSYWSYVHQLSYLGGPTLYSPLYLEPFHWFVILVACASYNYHLTIRQRLHGHCLRRYKKDQKNLQMIVNYTPNIPKHPQTSPNIPKHPQTSPSFQKVRLGPSGRQPNNNRGTPHPWPSNAPAAPCALHAAGRRASGAASASETWRFHKSCGSWESMVILLVIHSDLMGFHGISWDSRVMNFHGHPKNSCNQ